jgi:hypothetical protein
MEQGRLAGAVFDPARDDGRPLLGSTRAILAEATGVGVGVTSIFDCAMPPLPAMRKAAVFEF